MLDESITSFFETPTLSEGRDPDEQSPLLPSRALAELEGEFGLAISGDRPEGYRVPSQASKDFARDFIESLGLEDSPTDVYFDRAGHAVLEWHPGPHRAAVAVITSAGDVRYASTKFGARISGRDFLTGGIPAHIVRAIRHVAQ